MEVEYGEDVPGNLPDPPAPPHSNEPHQRVKGLEVESWESRVQSQESEVGWSGFGVWGRTGEVLADPDGALRSGAARHAVYIYIYTHTYIYIYIYI